MKIGDVLCVRKRLYYHYAIYIGNGKIVHLKSNIEKSGFSVQVTRIADYVKCTYVKVLSIDSFWRHFERSSVYNKALTQLGTPGYNVLTNNCAHFVCSCITGSRRFALLRMILKRRFIATLKPCSELFEDVSA